MAFLFFGAGLARVVVARGELFETGLERGGRRGDELLIYGGGR